MNANALTVALAGISGYGETYLEKLLACQDKGTAFAAAVEPKPERSKFLPELKSRGIPVFPDLEAMYRNLRPDLVILATPIHLHAPQSEFALAHGSNVLCEKPAAGSVADALSMLKAESNSNGLFLAIGYQWSYSDAILNLKADIASGLLGRPLRLRTMLLWPRPLSYYGRSPWAGAKTTPDGRPVYDSPVNNATAHYLHNCLFILGKDRGASAMPESVQAELYRANKIQNYDTAALRCMAGGTEILFYTTHASGMALGPVCSYEFENANVSYMNTTSCFTARFKDGSVKSYGNPQDGDKLKIPACIASIRGGEKPPCRIETALAQTRCMEAAQSCMDIAEFPEEFIEKSGCANDPVMAVRGMPDALSICFAQGLLPSETGAIPWARPGVKNIISSI